MNEEHTKELTDKFPWITPTDGYGIGVGDGWFDLLYVLCGNIHNGIKYDNECIQRYKEQPEGFTWKPHHTLLEYPRVDQIKEKFGGLRFYCSTPSEGCRYELKGMIQMAESMSFRICEVCGNKGETRDHAWKRTLCDVCEEENNRKESEFAKTRGSKR